MREARLVLQSKLDIIENGQLLCMYFVCMLQVCHLFALLDVSVALYTVCQTWTPLPHKSLLKRTRSHLSASLRPLAIYITT